MGTGERQPAGTPRGVRASLEVRLADMPEVLAGLRHEMAQVVLQAALDEGPEVQAFASRVAAAFEAGQGTDG